MCVRARARLCVSVCERVCARACVRACMRASVCVCEILFLRSERFLVPYYIELWNLLL